MGSSPKPPDPYQTANAQANANYQNAQQNVGFSNADVYSPYGSSTYTQTGWQPVYDNKGNITSYSPRYRQDVKLSAGEEALRQQNEKIRTNMGNLALQQSGRLQGLLSSNFDPRASIQAWTRAQAPGAVQNQIASAGAIRQDQAPTDRAAVQDAMMRMYDTDAQKQNAAEQAQAAARGMTAGGQGYGQMIAGQQKARTNALDTAFLASGQESRAAQDAFNQAQQQRFGQNAAQAQLFNQAALQKYQMGADYASQLNNLRQGQFTEAQQLRDQPIKEIASLMGFSGPNTPTFSPFQGTSMSAPNIQQAIYDNYNARAQQSQNRMSGLFGIGNAVAGALPWASWLSDKRLKEKIVPLRRKLAGVPLYTFTFRKHDVVPEHLQGLRCWGVIAQEARKYHPDAVTRGIDGYLRVDYDLLNQRHNERHVKQHNDNERHVHA